MKRHLVIATFAMLTAFALPVSAGDGSGQNGWGQGRGNNGGQNSPAYRAGYEEGFRDMQTRGVPQPNYYSRWKGADRSAYETGYRDGYRQAGTGGQGQYGRYPNDPYGRDDNRRRGGRDRDYGDGRGGGYGRGPNMGTALQRQAWQNGLTDGMFYGQRDWQNGKNNNPVNAKGYRDADHNYHSSLGSKGEFQRIYRQAFVEGYSRAYRQQRAGRF